MLQRKKTTKGVQSTFIELTKFLDVYREIMGITCADSVSSISSTLVNAKNEISKFKENLRQDIHKQVPEKCQGTKM